MINYSVLLLNQNYEPLNVCPVRRAVVLVDKGKAEILENGMGYIRTMTLHLSAPSVIRLIYQVKRPIPLRRLSRKETFQRDKFRCQYCGIESHEGAEMTKAVNDVLGDGCLMYASDFPHPECDWPRSVDNVISWGNVLGSGPLKKLLSGNAEKFLRMS